LKKRRRRGPPCGILKVPWKKILECKKNPVTTGQRLGGGFSLIQKKSSRGDVFCVDSGSWRALVPQAGSGEKREGGGVI